MNRQVRWLILGLITFIGAVLLWYRFPSQIPCDQNELSDNCQPDPERAAQLVPPRHLPDDNQPLSLQVGLRLHYELESEGYVEGQAPLGFQGTLVQTIVATQPQLQIEWRFDDITLQLPQQTPESEAIRLRAMQGAIVQYSADGRLQAPQVDEFWQSLLGRIQRTPGASDSWQAVEWTSMGSFVSNYTQQGEQWQKHLDGRVQDKSNLRVAISCGGTILHDFVQKETHCRESVQLQQPNSAGSLTIHNQTSLRFKSLDKINISSQPPQNHHRPVGQSMDEAVHRRQLGEQTLQEIWSNLHQEEKLEAYLALKAWIYLHPDRLHELLAALGQERFSHPAFRDVVRALTSVGSSESQKILRQLLSEQNQETVRYLLTQFAFVESPDVASENLLREIAKTHPDPRVRQSSQLTLGAVAHRLKLSQDEESQRRYEALERELFEHFEKAQSKEDYLARLAVIGNLGTSRLLAYVTNHWAEADDEQKTAMIWALRFVEDPKVWSYFDLGLNETDRRLREQSLQAIKFQKRVSQDQLRSVLKHLLNETHQPMITAWLQILVHYSLQDAAGGLLILQEWLDYRHEKNMEADPELEQLIAQTLQRMSPE